MAGLRQIPVPRVRAAGAQATARLTAARTRRAAAGRCHAVCPASETER
jgi:hypothetical protein